MKINKHQAHLTYCSNIHAGESWQETLSNLKEYTTKVRDGLTKDAFGIGLRLSGEASVELLEGNNLTEFKAWLAAENMYVFTINGFPYGGFHNVVVKENVHAPDWTTADRLNYTKRLFDILAELLPEGMDGGVSTSPLSYKFWHKTAATLEQAKQTGLSHLVEVMLHLHAIKKATGKSLHLDMEPEPDGIIENTEEFIDFYTNYMLKGGLEAVAEKLNCSNVLAEEIIREHFQLCYDVCHFAVGFEEPSEAIKSVLSQGIRVGRIQISAALGSGILGSEEEREVIKEQLSRFDEPTYLHQAVAKKSDESLLKFGDLGPGLEVLKDGDVTELRTHFHVPVFTEKYEKLISTQADIIKTLAIWTELNFTNHLEVETYTWDVLPKAMQTDIVSCVVRELDWVRDEICD